jgi:lincosamide nucleotidyltransferase A/C/D/E
MPPEAACALVAALDAREVDACVGGGWAIDALVGRRTREHADLDLWVEASDLEGLFAAFADQGLDRVHPWPGDRPWNFVLHDAVSRRVDLHLYEPLEDGRLHYGSVTAPFVFDADSLSGTGDIEGQPIRCETADFALRNHTGYPIRDVDRYDVATLCETFGLPLPEDFR